MSGDRHATFLELVLRLHGDFRRTLEPIRVTPLQAGVLLYLHRNAGARQTDAATALRVQTSTMGEVVQDLVRKGWVSKRRSGEDRRALCLRLSRKGKTIIRRIKHQIRHMEAHAEALRQVLLTV